VKKIIVLAAVVSMSSAFSVEYPKELLGRFVDLQNNAKNACENPQVVIEKTSRFNDVDAMCKPTKVSRKKISSTLEDITVVEKCEREDSKWSQTAVFQSGGLMLVTEKSKYQGETILRLKPC